MYGQHAGLRRCLGEDPHQRDSRDREHWLLAISPWKTDQTYFVCQIPENLTLKE